MAQPFDTGSLRLKGVQDAHLSHFNISHEYDLTRDGQRLLIGTLVGQPKVAPTVMLNWTAALKKNAGLQTVSENPVHAR